jgi:hypothetical protein
METLLPELATKILQFAICNLQYFLHPQRSESVNSTCKDIRPNPVNHTSIPGKGQHGQLLLEKASRR